MKKRIKKVFTFPGSEESPPAYIDLCLKTWKKNFPLDYEIITLNLKTAPNYIYDESLKRFLLNYKGSVNSIVLNYIKACVLYFNGGVFMDADTLLVKNFYLPEEILKHHEVVVFGNSPVSACLGFVMALFESPLLKEYINRLKKVLEKSDIGDVSGTKIFNDMLLEGYNSKVLVIDAESSGYYTEKSLYGVCSDYLRTQLYFSNTISLGEFLDNTKGISVLSSKCVPQKYKNMNEDELLSQDNLLVQIFNACLKKD